MKKTASSSRYKIVSEEKAGGATYTPKVLADFVAQRIIDAFPAAPSDRGLRILDPAVGDGELLLSLLQCLSQRARTGIEVYGFEPDPRALKIAAARIKEHFRSAVVNFEPGSFLEFVLEQFGQDGAGTLFGRGAPQAYDLIIANPPYVRTQIMGAQQAQLLAEQFDLSGRVDLYYPFILAMARVLKPDGIAGIIVSNRFMTTKSGAAVRRAILQHFNVLHVWDLGDTKLFDAAVLPAVILARGKRERTSRTPYFTSIYETDEAPDARAANPIEALTVAGGVVQTDDGKRFMTRHGALSTSGESDGVWRVATKATDSWLATVQDSTWRTFRDIGKTRVGVKTCADKVFIRSDWESLPESERPELLRPLLTHHNARKFKARTDEKRRQILYPHELVQGERCAVELSAYPRSAAYLGRYRDTLEARTYVTQAGRKWYEIWVAQDPGAWAREKLVFRDIAEEPAFWVDLDGSIVNGDCYWIVCDRTAETDLLWLAAAVANSKFIEAFYDHRFNNKLYAGRRRFMTQYVEQFPLPDPSKRVGKAIIAMAKEIYNCIPSLRAEKVQTELNQLVFQAFGLPVEEGTGKGNL